MSNKKEGFIFTIPFKNFNENKLKFFIIKELPANVVWGHLNDNGDVIIHVEYDVESRKRAKELVEIFVRECEVRFSQFPCYSCANALCVFNNTPKALLPTKDNVKGEVEIFTCFNANCREKEEED